MIDKETEKRDKQCVCGHKRQGVGFWGYKRFTDHRQGHAEREMRVKQKG